MNDLFHTVRKERGWTERLQALEEAILTHYVQLPRTPQMDIRPPCIEFALMKECRALAEAPSTRTITSNDFLAIIPTLAARWLAEKADMLRSQLRTLLKPSPQVKDPLELAVAVWVCKHCKARLRFPAVLAHPCAYQRPSSEVSSYPWLEYIGCARADYVHTAASLTQRRDKNGTLSVAFDTVNFVHDVRDVVKTLSHIVRTLGLDPACALATDLDKCEARLYCQRCLRDGLRRAYAWEAAVSTFRITCHGHTHEES